jgi:hypothetical protein
VKDCISACHTKSVLDAEGIPFVSYDSQFIQKNSLFSLSFDTNYILLVVLLFPQWWESQTGTSGS